MTYNRRGVLTGAGALGLMPLMAQAQSDPLLDAQRALINGDAEAFYRGIETLRAYGKPDIAPGLILAMRFTRAPDAPIVDLLRAVTGENPGDNWFRWMLWQERRADIRPHPSYIPFKRQAYLQIDPNFEVFLKPEYLQPNRMGIRLEEISWGGVRKDGIPSLDNPTMTSAAQATYLRDDDLVFGVSINGDARAYPLRIMGWHEMFNDTIGGVPLALAYCTLCGSGILFETRARGRRQPFIFGSSGFLYRSNKLMFDRQTHSLWNQFTGEPVVGPLTGSGITLNQRPVAITSWAEWRRANPGTTALSLQTGHRRDYGSGVVYRDYFSSPNLMFPTNVDQSRHRQKDYVFGIRVMGASKAWPLTAFNGRRVINDGIAGQPLVLIGDAATRTVRAYERSNLSFTPADAGLTSNDGVFWSVGEEALSASDGRTLPRVAGHIAYWFAWNGYLGAESELYRG